MVPYIDTVIRERQQRFLDEAAWQRRLARSRAQRSARVRLSVSRTLVALGQRLGAGRRLARARDWSAATSGCGS